MSKPDSVKIEFPCDYPIKIMGPNADDFAAAVLAIVREHAPDLDEDRVNLRASRNGNYLAVNLSITATGRAQLEAIFLDLKASGRVTLVL